MKKIQSNWIKLALVGAILIIFYRLTDDLSGTKDNIKAFIGVFTPCIIGAVIAFFLYRPTEKLESLFDKCKADAVRKRKKGLAVLTVYIVIIVIVAISVDFIIPGISKNVKELIKNAPDYLKKAEKILSENEFLSHFNFLDDAYDRVARFIKENISFEKINMYISVLSGAVNSFMSFFLGIVFSVYILLQTENIKKLFDKICIRTEAGKKCGILRAYGNKMLDLFYSYFSALALDAVIMGTITAVVLGVFKVPYAVLLGLIVAIGNMVPFFGPIVAAIVTYVITAIAFDPFKAIWVIVFQLVLGQIDGNLIQPKILGKSTGLNPLLVLFSVVVFGDLFGFFGMIMGVPVIAALKMLFDDYLDNGKAEASK